MKSKLVVVAVFSVVLFSCASKTIAPKVVEKEVAKTVALRPELAEGKSMYENSCARCHKLFEATAFSKEEWKPILISMQKRAKLDDVKMASITYYINSQL